MSSLSILVADDHAMVRHGLRAVLEHQPGWKVRAEADNGRDAVRLVVEMKPHLAVLDISMPGLNGLEAARQIRKDAPETEVLILTMHESEQLVADVIDAGARGYILKSDTPRLLVAAVEAVASHNPFFTGTIAQMILDGRLRPGESGENAAAAPRLTPREREIVQLLAEGGTNKEIAGKLGVSVKTVDAHRTNIMRRLNLNSLAELVRYAIRENIIQP